MSVIAPPGTLEKRRILWIEDYAEDLEGVIGYLRYCDQSVVVARTFEAGAYALQRDIVDLVVVDQQLPKDDRKTDDAGSILMDQLKASAFGTLNLDVPFVFVTGSSDWVLDCEIDVTGMQGFLGIEEKAGDLLGWFFENLPKLSQRATHDECESPSRATELESAEGDDGGERDDQPDRMTETWRGLITDVDDTSFRARLIDVADVLPDHEVRFPHRVVSAAERDRISEGAQFTWSARTVDDESGRRSVVSSVAFLPRSPLTDHEIDEALKRAHERRAARADRDA